MYKMLKPLFHYCNGILQTPIVTNIGKEYAYAKIQWWCIVWLNETTF
jgi:succinate dehydrogenase/fumarate reductase cytochrome b subunit